MKTRLLCLHLCGILLCLFLKPLTAQIQTDQEKLDEYIAFEGQRYDAFEWNLLKALGSPEFGNVLISPLSVKMVLAMLYEGASGATEKELEQVVNFPPNKQDTKKKFQRIIKSLNTATAGQTLDMGSRVFLDSSVQPQQRFEAALKDFYDTDVKPVDFLNTSVTKDEINYWVSNVTHGYIRDLVAEGDLEGATMILTNALYYKGLWRNPFPIENTNLGVFYTVPNKPIHTQFMNIEYPFYYGDSIELDAKILRLPFQGGNIAMFILLPNSKAGLPRLINDLNPQVLRRQINVMGDDKFVNVYLPKFTFEFNARLGRILQSLGLHHIFQNTASLAGIARGKGVLKKLMVTNILQKAGIVVNEEGSTAYAATNILLASKVGGTGVNFNASHPFLFYIEDEFTGNVLFAGKVENPVQGAQPPFREELNFPNRFGEVNPAETKPSPSSSSEAPVATTTNAQNQNFGNLNQNFGNQNQNFGTQGQNFGTANFYPQYEDKDLSAEQFFYFDTDLLKEIANDQRDGNILISPLSIKSVLAMILEGAIDETAEELKMALHLPSNDRVRQQFQKLLTEFEHPKGNVNLKMANRIFISNKFTPLPSYRNIITRYYFSNITEVDFSSPVQSAETINSWVNEQTHGVIPTIVDEGSFGEIFILLANALYFKGMWEKAFSGLGTKVNCFYLTNGECQMSPMMDVVDNFKYDEVKTLDAKVIELPYDGGEYSMVVVLPNKRNGIHQLARDIRTSINSIVHDMNKTEVFVTLPRFKIDYNVDLVDYLPKVHVSNMFSPQAKLNNIVVEVATRVSNVLHKTYMEVNEQGTVAAAATGAVVIPLMGTTKPRFKADHPFLFFIRHISTGTILFEGRLSIPERSYTQQNPQQNQQSNPQQNPQQRPQQNPQQRPQQNTQQRPQQNPQQRPQQGNRQQSGVRPTQPQNNFNQNVRGQTQPQLQTSFASSQQTPFLVSQGSQQSVSFQSPTPSNFQSQQPQFQSPSQTAYDSSFQDFDSTRQYVLKHMPPLTVLPESTRLVQQTQSDDSNVNDLRNNEQVKPSYNDNEKVFYEGEINDKHRQ